VTKNLTNAPRFRQPCVCRTLDSCADKGSYLISYMKQSQQYFADAKISFHLQIRFEDLRSRELEAIINLPFLVFLSVLHIVKKFLFGEPSSHADGRVVAQTAFVPFCQYFSRDQGSIS
jgi:hypothetical protein